VAASNRQADCQWQLMLARWPEPEAIAGLVAGEVKLIRPEHLHAGELLRVGLRGRDQTDLVLVADVFGQLAEKGIVRIQNHPAARNQTGQDFRFGLENFLLAAEPFDMGQSDRRDQSDIRTGDPAEQFNFTAAAHAQFEHNGLVLRRCGEQGLGQSDFIVIVGLRLANLEAGLKAGCDHAAG